MPITQSKWLRQLSIQALQVFYLCRYRQLNLWVYPGDFVTLPLWKGGSEVVFDMYTATVIWDGQIQFIDVAASEADPLIGMSLLYGFKLMIEAIEDGTVTIEALSIRS